MIVHFELYLIIYRNINFKHQKQSSTSNADQRIGQTRIPGYSRGGIWCLGRVSIPCRPVTHDPTYILFENTGDHFILWGSMFVGTQNFTGSRGCTFLQQKVLQLRV
jgi:hypothetical protein